MISKISENGRPSYGVCEFLCDSEEDIANLPTRVAPGSTALILDTNQTIYILSNKNKWVKMK